MLPMSGKMGVLEGNCLHLRHAHDKLHLHVRLNAHCGAETIFTKSAMVHNNRAKVLDKPLLYAISCFSVTLFSISL